ncbi:MAG: DUF1194 domain-containing protein [Hyphomicrobiales bacterium]|nr:DUF1194 domain-containing protein [Hyphomicrobiales bacterium]
MIRSFIYAAVAAVFSSSAPSTASAADMAVDLELVLAVDISRSMDDEEQRLQRDGYVAAFRHPEIQQAILSGRYRRIAVAFVEWAGTNRFFLRVPWALIDSERGAEAFADRLAALPLEEAARTSISGALEFAADQFKGNGYQGLRRVIDISGDGPNNMGSPVHVMRDEIVARGIVINGLPLILSPSVMAGFERNEELAWYYEDCVIGGFGSFFISVVGKAAFPEAIRSKLILEMSDRHPRVLRVQHKSRAKMDCLIGEKMWDRGWD